MEIIFEHFIDHPLNDIELIMGLIFSFIICFGLLAKSDRKKVITILMIIIVGTVSLSVLIEFLLIYFGIVTF